MTTPSGENPINLPEREGTTRRILTTEEIGSQVEKMFGVTDGVMFKKEKVTYDMASLGVIGQKDGGACSGLHMITVPDSSDVVFFWKSGGMGRFLPFRPNDGDVAIVESDAKEQETLILFHPSESRPGVATIRRLTPAKLV